MARRTSTNPAASNIATHLGLLRRAGFEAAACLRVFEEELEAPTAAQNYACLRGIRGVNAASRVPGAAVDR